MVASPSEDIPPTGRALLAAFAGAVHGAIVGGFSIALFDAEESPNLLHGAWFIAATIGIGFCLAMAYGLKRAVATVTGTVTGSVVGVLAGLAMASHSGILFAAIGGSVLGGILGACRRLNRGKNQPPGRLRPEVVF